MMIFQKETETADLEVQMSNLLALDQSSRITGYAIFEDSKLVKYGKFEVSDNNID